MKSLFIVFFMTAFSLPVFSQDQDQDNDRYIYSRNKEQVKLEKEIAELEIQQSGKKGDKYYKLWKKLLPTEIKLVEELNQKEKAAANEVALANKKVKEKIAEVNKLSEKYENCKGLRIMSFMNDCSKEKEAVFQADYERRTKVQREYNKKRDIASSIKREKTEAISKLMNAKMELLEGKANNQACNGMNDEGKARSDDFRHVRHKYGLEQEFDSDAEGRASSGL